MSLTLPQPKTPRQFTLAQRLTIVQQLIHELRPQDVLKVLVIDDPMMPHLENLKQQNIVYTYELAGSKSLKRTQNNNLFQKLDQMHKHQIQKALLNKHPDVSNAGEENQEVEVKTVAKPNQDNTQKAVYRYFSQNVKCFRCKKMGHHDFACLDEFSCFFCLSPEHMSDKCPQRCICFRCFKFGHILSECPSRQQPPNVCMNCRRRHFDKCGFMMRGMEQVKQVIVMDGLYFKEEIRCLKCLKYGHYNCEAMEMMAGGGQFKRPYSMVGSGTGEMMADRERVYGRNDRVERNDRGQRNQRMERNDRLDRNDRNERKDSRDRYMGGNGNKKHKY